MSSSSRIKRNQQKLAYDKFGKSWRAEQRYQNSILASGEKLPEGTPRLKRKPTFSMWLNITKTVQAQKTAEPIEVQQFVEETNLDWDEEEGTTKSSGDPKSEQQPSEVQDQ